MTSTTTATIPSALHDTVLMTGEAYPTCETCNKIFKTPAALKTHNTRIHKENTVTVATKTPKTPRKARLATRKATPAVKAVPAPQEAPAATPKAKKTPHACACAGWTVAIGGEQTALKGAPKAHRDALEYDNETHWNTISLECGKMTTATFAPGHDARFKGLAITATRFGGEMQIDRGGVLVSMSPEQAVASVSPGLLAFLPAKPAASAA